MNNTRHDDEASKLAGSNDADRVLVNVHRVAKLASCSARTIRTWSEQGRMPKPVIFSSKVWRWDLQAVRDWIAAGAPDLREVKTPESTSK